MQKIVWLCIGLFFYSLAMAQNESTNWFVFQPNENYEHSRITMKSWLDAPAGKHGFLQMKGDDLVFSDGTAVKFWGVNIASNKPFVPHDEASKWTNFMATYGINAVRFHKFTWEATDGIHSTVITDDKWNNFDFFTSKLKKQGIYYAWSHIYGHRVLPADSSRLLAYSEIAHTKFPWSHLNGTTASLVNFAEDLQALNIELTVNMLNHRNPNTGLRYADDPALAYIELQNEDNIFWAAIEESLKQAPTYRALLCRKFSQWLQQKYGTQEALEKAWGTGVIPPDQTLEKENIYPQPNHGMFSYESQKTWQNKTPLPQHIVDKAEFLYEEQSKFYHHFVQAIRRTGYKGLIVGSCWQAGSGIAHLLNLYSDYEVGAIDRHNYFGGGTGHTLIPGKVANTAMVSHPGSGLLSTGFQQVSNRPFFISEWMSLIPNEYTAEAAPIIAAYGLGLQGWDASFAFAMDNARFTNTIQSGHSIYNVTSPTQLALYPAITAMIYRNDIKEGNVVADRKVSLTQLAKGDLPFFEKVAQESDVKNLQSSVPLQALAMGKVTLTFTKEPEKSTVADLKKWWDSTAKIVRATTGQLQWDYNEKGYFTINSKGTEGVVGFAKDKVIQLDDITLKTTNPFAVILISSLEKDKVLSNANHIIITTIAKARNTDMKYNEQKTELLEVGAAPILLEPVTVEVSLLKKKKFQVFVLDHDGNRTEQQVPVKGNQILLDGAKYKTLYYEIVSH